MAIEKCKKNKKIYEGRILDLHVDEVELVDGTLAIREVIEHKPAVGVLALTARDTILLVRQFRYAVGKEMLEICAGLVEDGEDLKATAERELQEELGYFPRALREIASFYVTPGYCREKITIFLAMDLVESKLKQDDDENLETVEIEASKISELLASGEIEDGKTWGALVWFLAERAAKNAV